MGRLTFWLLLGLTLFAASFNGVSGSGSADLGPSESECRPYIEKAIHELKTGEPSDKDESVLSPETTSGTTNLEPDQDDDDDEEMQSDQPTDDNNDGDDDGDDDDDDGDDDKDNVETVEITDADSTEDDDKVDTDGDGIPNEEDADIDGDVIPNDQDEDIDGDGILNIHDDDIDGDNQVNEKDPDMDGDGVLNEQDKDIDGDGILNIHDEDIDGDSVPNEADSDLDGDGILNVHDEDIDGDSVLNVVDNDLDGDGILNIHDEDIDGDSVPNVVDADLDGDGVPNVVDKDIDGDGVANLLDNDLDGDGIPNEEDDDMDGDGIPNEEDNDMDGDGIPNEEDDDMDGDGIPNEEDSDMDGDGIPNDEDDDKDGDGIPNHEDNDMDGDGVPNDEDDDIDGDGIPNNEDDDKDGDGILNHQDSDEDGDGMHNDEEPKSLDIDGDGIPNDDDSDIDGDVIPNERDEDMDGDGILNVHDSDVDGDGVPNVHDDDSHEVGTAKPESEEEEEVVEEVVKRGKREIGVKAAPIEAKQAEPAADDDDDDDEDDTEPEDDLLWEGEIPANLRSRDHITELLQLNEEFNAREKAVDNVAEIILRDIKRIYENAIKPLEAMYKYRDLSNRHFSDPEIFSKPLVLFMGPWSGGKSSTINYLTNNEYTTNSLRTGAEPSPAYFNILMWGNETEVLDGTQLAADYTFSGLQKFGEGLEDRLRGIKMPNKLLEKINIVEIPGILEVRKQVSRLFPFNDACQWFIDRADIIFLVYDPAKLDVGPETEAILDQLKGREYQTRIILNKADTVKPEELLRVQSALIWNISPLMSSAQPPLVYTTSLWSHPYQDGAPARLLLAQERAFLRDLRTAVDKRIEHKIASARRFAVRVRNHAKMVDCYLNTYYNHKTLFGNKKRIADDIIDHPQNYHIYEGLSTLTNISRYDLPDPEVYRDFFRLNPLYEFKKLAETCTYFRGCPISKLDVAIAYDLPELAGKYKKMAEAAQHAADAKEAAPPTTPTTPGGKAVPKS